MGRGTGGRRCGDPWILAGGTAPQPWQNPFADAVPFELTNWSGTETDAAISRNGEFVALVADRDGPFDVFLTQVGSGVFRNFTNDENDDRANSSAVSNVGFAGDGSNDVWLAGPPSGEVRPIHRMALLFDGQRRNFLDEKIVNVAWSANTNRTTYYRVADGDPMYSPTATAAIRPRFTRANPARTIMGPSGHPTTNGSTSHTDYPRRWTCIASGHREASLPSNSRATGR